MLSNVDDSLEQESFPAFDAPAVYAPNDSLATVSSVAELFFFFLFSQWQNLIQ